MEMQEYIDATFAELARLARLGPKCSEPNEFTLARRCFVDGVAVEDAAQVMAAALTFKAVHDGPKIRPVGIGDLVEFTDTAGVRWRGLLVDFKVVQLDDRGLFRWAFVAVPAQHKTIAVVPDALTVVVHGFYSKALRAVR